MEIKSKVLPLLLSGTLAFGSMGAPITALADEDTVSKYNEAAEKTLSKQSTNKDQTKQKAVETQKEEPKAETPVVVEETVQTPENAPADEPEAPNAEKTVRVDMASVNNAVIEASSVVDDDDSNVSEDKSGADKTAGNSTGSDEFTESGKTVADGKTSETDGSKSGSSETDTADSKSDSSKTGVDTAKSDDEKPASKNDEAKSDDKKSTSTADDEQASEKDLAAEAAELGVTVDQLKVLKAIEDKAVYDAVLSMMLLPVPDAVTAKSKGVIEAAAAQYAALSSAQQALIAGDAALAPYKNTLDADVAALAKVTSADPKDETGKADAEKTDAEKAAEEEAAKQAAEEQAAKDAAAAQEAADAIAALPALDKIAAGDEKAVYAAKAAYYKLTDAQKKLVDSALVDQMKAAVKAVDKAVAAEKKAAADKKAADEKAAAEKKAAEEKAAAEKRAAEQSAASAVQSDSYNSSYSGQGYTRIKYTTNLSTEMFIASIGEQARQIGQDKNLYASVMIAQAIIESDSGNSGLSQAPNYNLFGIKGAYEGQSVNMATQEDDGAGNLYGINSDFRRYGNQKESLADYADLLRSNMGLYYNAWKENADTYQDAAKALQGTYATSTIYADSICAVIEAYDLTRFDEPLKYELEGTIYDPESSLADKDGYRALTMDDYASLQGNAISFLGTPYVWGGTTPDGFDCSGFMQYLYKTTFGIDLPRTTYAQQHEGVEVPFTDLQMGDLLFFNDGGSTEHVAMYLGEGFYIHAPETGDVIKIADMESYTPSFAKRILKTVPVEDDAEAVAADAAAEPAGDQAEPVADQAEADAPESQDAESQDAEDQAGVDRAVTTIG